MKKKITKKSVLAMLILISVSLAGCSQDKEIDVTSSEILESTTTSSYMPVSSEEPTSSEEPVSSEKPTSSEKPAASKPATSKPTSTDATSKNPVSSETEEERMDRKNEEYYKEQMKPINSFVTFSITDNSGNLIEGVTTLFGFRPPSGYYQSYDQSAKTDKLGRNSVQLRKQDINFSVFTIRLTWEKPFKATVTTPLGDEYNTSSETLKDGGYTADFGLPPEYTSYSSPITDNQTLAFNVVIEEITE